MVVVFYAIAGGMMAGVYTDLFQGALMVVAAIAVFVYALRAAGGLARDHRAHRRDRLASARASSTRWAPSRSSPRSGFFFVFGVGKLGQPHMLHKFYMLDDPRKLKWMPLVVGVTQTLCVLIWLGIGLAVPALVAARQTGAAGQSRRRVAPLPAPLRPAVLAGLVFAGILAAIMSTADSFVNIGSAALVRDLPRALGRPVRARAPLGPEGRRRARRRRRALRLALRRSDRAARHLRLRHLRRRAGAGARHRPELEAGHGAAATASIATGMVLNLVLEFLAKQTFFEALPKPPFPAGVLPTAVSLAASFCVLLLLSWGPGRREGLPKDVEAVMDC